MSSDLNKSDSSNQLSMFRDIYGREKGEGSNIFNDWDFHPVYSVSKQEEITLKRGNSKLPIISHNYLLDGHEFTINITPAYINTKMGEEFFYPSEREEIVELGLRKLMMQYNSSVHIPKKETWVKFTLNELLKVLKASSHSMDLNDLKQSLEIMQKCSIQIVKGKQKSYEGSILLEVLKTDREDYVSNGVSEWAVSFNSLITSDIDNLNFRQINNRTLMLTKMQISKQIIKLLVRNFKNAGLGAPAYKLQASEVIGMCRLNCARSRDNYAAIRKSLNEIRTLKDADNFSAIIPENDSDIATMVEEEILKKGNKIVDIIFHITPSKSFIDFVKAANKRDKNFSLT